MPWIHIDDLCRLFLQALTDPKLSGPFNGIAPHHVTNREMVSALAKALSRPLWLPPVPGLILKLIFGQMSVIILEGSRISSDKITRSGFSFHFPKLDQALSDLLGRPRRG